MISILNLLTFPFTREFPYIFMDQDEIINPAL